MKKHCLNQLANEVHAVVAEKGFWPDSIEISEQDGTVIRRVPCRSMLELLCLVHTEVSEAAEAWREGQHAMGYERDAREGVAKPTGVPSELADIIIRVLDISAAFGIDIGDAVDQKMAYNRTRPYRHGDKLA